MCSVTNVRTASETREPHVRRDSNIGLSGRPVPVPSILAYLISLVGLLS